MDAAKVQMLVNQLNGKLERQKQAVLRTEAEIKILTDFASRQAELPLSTPASTSAGKR